MTNVLPYVAEFEANSQKQPGAITKEGSRIAFLAQLLQEKIVKNNAKLKKSGPLISLARAKDLVYNQMIEKRTKPRKIYKMEEVFSPEFLETKPNGVRHGAIDAEESTWEGMPEHEILEGSMPDSSDLLIDSGHHAIVGDLKPMRGTGYLKQIEQYPGSTDLIMDPERYEGNYTHLRLANSIAWYRLNEFRGMKIIIVADSMIGPTTHFPYLHQDVALVAMPQSTLQQRAALVAATSDAIEQVTPIIVLLGFDDHLDLNGHLKKLFAKNVTTHYIHDAGLCVH